MFLKIFGKFVPSLKLVFNLGQMQFSNSGKGMKLDRSEGLEIQIKIGIQTEFKFEKEGLFFAPYKTLEASF